MTIIVAIDDQNGMMFNNRRQSQDSILRKRILSVSKGHTLWMNEYSAKQFASENDSSIIVDNDFLKKAKSEDYCFVENTDVLPYLERVDSIVIYKWNRVYPGDVFFTVPMTEWTMKSTSNFVGSSHEKITEEMYVK